MFSSVIRPAALAASLSLLSLAASAQTFGEFLNKPDLPLTFMGVDFSNARYSGPAMTVDANEMKTQFTHINELMVHEAEKYNIGKALQRTKPVENAIFIAESVNQKADPGAITVPSSAAPREKFTEQTVRGLVSHYQYPAASKGVGIVFVVEDISKLEESETFWVTFVNLDTKKVLYTEKMTKKGAGFGFRNHWARPFYEGIENIKSHYRDWQKKFAKG